MNRLILIASLLYSAPGHSEADKETFILAYSLPGLYCEGVALIYPGADWEELADSAAIVCLKKYGPRSPCLVKFEQVGPNDYQATCGAKQ